MPIRLSVDSTVTLTRFALGTINGAIHQQRVQRDRILISTQYTRERPDGITQVTIIAAVRRKPAAADSGATIVELNAWAVDYVEAPRTRTLSGRRIQTITSNAPIGNSAQDQPYLVTPSKAPHDWKQVEEVLSALVAIAPTRPRSGRHEQKRATATGGPVAVDF